MTDVLIIGGGVVGSAIAYGLARQGSRVILLDGDDADHRAAQANFGLVWLQGKGTTLPGYHRLTRHSVDAWPAFNDELARRSGIDLAYERNGGLVFSLGEADFAARHAELHRLHNVTGGAQDWEMLDRPALERLLPGVALGPDVVGASYGRSDGCCNPLRLLAALHGSVLASGGTIVRNARVEAIEPGAGGFRVDTAAGRFAAPKVVLAAGLGTEALARQVGLHVPLHPERGQVLVTERCERFLPLPCSGMRQTAEGTVMLGATQERVGFDTLTTGAGAAHLAIKAARIVPRLARARVVRQWAGLRVKTPDGFPVYAQSAEHPGAFAAVCHSGVTLAAFHATTLAAAIIAGALPDDLSFLHGTRFDVPHAA